MQNNTPELPASVVGWSDAFVGLTVVLVLFFYLRTVPTILLSDQILSIVLVLSVGLIIGAIEVYRAPWRKLAPPRDQLSAIFGRAAFKLLGFFSTLATIAVIYWLLPEYHRDYYVKFFQSALLVIPYLVAVCIPYFLYVEWRLPRERGGMWEMALFVVGKWDGINWPVFSQYALGWLVKAFFIPIMFGDIVNGIGALRAANWDFMATGFVPSFYVLFNAFVILELVFVSAGYAFACRLFDSQIRRVEHTLFGWTVAVISYSPFLSLFYVRYFNYSDGAVGWLNWLTPHPTLVVLWGSVIIALLIVHMWCDACFGVRFSNLTNRGIITNGPYRFSKHPAYFIKNIRWWMVSVPFVVADPSLALQLSLLLVCVNILYTMRSYAEERLLSRDPTYVAYARWMDQNGLLKFFKRIPVLSYEWRLARWQREWPEVYQKNQEDEIVRGA